MAIPVRRGRAFDDRDKSGSLAVAIVNETAAQRLWPGVDPIGQTLMVPDFGALSPKEVIGIVGDTRHHDLAKEPEPEIYRPAAQVYWPFFGLVVRTPATAQGLERTLRDAAARVDSAVPVNRAQSLAALADSTWAWRRSSMLLLGVFAAAACVLAFVGVYGVMAFGVAERARDWRPRRPRRTAGGCRQNDTGSGCVADRRRHRWRTRSCRARRRRPATAALRRRTARSADVPRCHVRHSPRRSPGHSHAGVDGNARRSDGGAERRTALAAGRSRLAVAQYLRQLVGSSEQPAAPAVRPTCAARRVAADAAATRARQFPFG